MAKMVNFAATFPELSVLLQIKGFVCIGRQHVYT